MEIRRYVIRRPLGAAKAAAAVASLYVSVFTRRSGDGSGATMSCRFYILAYLKVTLHACRSPQHPHICAIHFLWDANALT